MKFIGICYAACMCVVLTSAQFFGNIGNDLGFGYNSLSGDFGGASAFGGNFAPSSIRDPRQNRGPVVFPDPPADGPVESSGVIVGASGFGFVPPNGQSSSHQTRSSSLRYNPYFSQIRFY